MRLSKRWKGLAATAVAVMGMGALTTLPAEAVNTCYAEHDKQAVNWAPDKHRVEAMCKQLNPGRQARGRLDMDVCCDKETVWFSTTYRWYQSAWAQGSYGRVWYETRTN